MKSQLMLGVFVTAAAVVNVMGFPEDPAEYAAWEKRMLIEAQELSEKPPDEAIPELSLRLYQLSQPRNRDLKNRGVFPAVRDALLSIPGHATYYGNRIKELSDAYFNEPDPAKAGILRSNLSNQRMYDFQKLELMPSPEAVLVLGDLLYDERGSIPGTQGYDEVPYHSVGSNSKYALRGLANLPLESKPLKPRKNNFVIYEQDIGAWRLWYEQIKAGTRTFRFEGDPQDYSLAGPVAEALTPSVGGRPSPLPAKEASSEVVTKEASHRPLGFLVVAGALVVGVLCYGMFLKARRKTKL